MHLDFNEPTEIGSAGCVKDMCTIQIHIINVQTTTVTFN